jgi:hypothetical protein
MDRAIEGVVLVQQFVGDRGAGALALSMRRRQALA